MIMLSSSNKKISVFQKIIVFLLLGILIFMSLIWYSDFSLNSPLCKFQLLVLVKLKTIACDLLQVVLISLFNQKNKKLYHPPFMYGNTMIIPVFAKII